MISKLLLMGSKRNNDKQTTKHKSHTFAYAMRLAFMIKYIRV